MHVAEHLCASARSRRSDSLLAQLSAPWEGADSPRRLVSVGVVAGDISDYGHGSWWSSSKRAWPMGGVVFPRAMVGDVPGAHCRRRARRECCQRPSMMAWGFIVRRRLRRTPPRPRPRTPAGSRRAPRRVLHLLARGGGQLRVTLWWTSHMAATGWCMTGSSGRRSGPEWNAMSWSR